MTLTGGSFSTRRKTWSNLGFPLQIPHGMALDRTGATVLKGRRLTARAMARTHKSGSFLTLRPIWFGWSDRHEWNRVAFKTYGEHSNRCLSYERFTASSKASSSQRAI